jgi:hypothetical protein
MGKVLFTICATIVGLLALLAPIQNRALASDVFVRPARGPGLSTEQRELVTDLVKRAVRRMPEHMLVQSEAMADFVLEPTLLSRNGKLVLRVEKYRDGELLAQSEDSVRSVSTSGTKAYAITENAMSNDKIAIAEKADIDGRSPQDASSREAEASVSGASSSGQDDLGALPSDVRSQLPPSATDTSDAMTKTTSSVSNVTSDSSSGDLRAASPIFQRPDTSGFFQLGVGPAITSGIGSNNVLFDINGSYNAPINELVIGKAFGDFNLADSASPQHFIELGLGAEFYPWRQALLGGTPYLDGDIGYAFARDNLERSQSALAVGGGAGFKFAASDLILDLSVHYSVLTTQLLSNNPSVLDLRAAINF